MHTYLFQRLNGQIVEVETTSETHARHLAMTQIWGPPTGIYLPVYQGKGLDLIVVTPRSTI